MKSILLLLASAFAFLPLGAAAANKKLKVFILAGQSNMEGHAKVETFDYIGDDPATAPLLKEMRDSDGKAHVCDHVWISYFTGSGDQNGEGFGKLTAGYGSRRNPAEDGGKIGPEFTFGLTLDKAIDGPVLLIKTAWGGKSLYYDFRPPGAGVYPRPPKDIEKNQNPEANSGLYYRLMVEHVKKVLADPKRVCPAYDAAAGYELCGFIWLQGWNDMVNRDVYPIPGKDAKEPRYAKYSDALAHLIRDVRKDFGAPKLPFVIGVMGVDGAKPNEGMAAFREAMTAPALLPEFKGNVTAVPTAPFWSEELGAIDAKREKVRSMGFTLQNEVKKGTLTEPERQEKLKKFEADLISPAEAATWKRGASNAGYHYLGCAKTFALMGRAFAEANLALLRVSK